jgi:hypothetical protein
MIFANTCHGRVAVALVEMALYLAAQAVSDRFYVAATEKVRPYGPDEIPYDGVAASVRSEVTHERKHRRHLLSMSIGASLATAAGH